MRPVSDVYVRLIRNKNNWKLAGGGNKPAHPPRPGIKESKDTSADREILLAGQWTALRYRIQEYAAVSSYLIPRACLHRELV